MKNSNKTWLITGCSSGLGKAFAEEVLAYGYNAVVTSRNPKDIQDIVTDYPETALGLALDVTDKDQITNAVKQTKQKFGGIDILLNNAGYGFRGAVEEANEQEMHNLFDTNFFGTVHMIQAVLPVMREQRSGTIFNVSSIAGRFSNPASGYYSATKYAIEGMSDDFAGRSLTGAKKEISDYDETAGKRRKENDETHGTQPGDPKKAAQAIIKIEKEKQPPFRFLMGSDAIEIIQKELKQQMKELEDWKEISLTTDFK